jgi:hypothetical protein
MSFSWCGYSTSGCPTLQTDLVGADFRHPQAGRPPCADRADPLAVAVKHEPVREDPRISIPNGFGVLPPARVRVAVDGGDGDGDVQDLVEREVAAHLPRALRGREERSADGEHAVAIPAEERGMPTPVRVATQPQRVPPGRCLLAESEEAIRIPVVRQAACACKTNVLRLNRG